MGAVVILSISGLRGGISSASGAAIGEDFVPDGWESREMTVPGGLIHSRHDSVGKSLAAVVILSLSGLRGGISCASAPATALESTSPDVQFSAMTTLAI